MALYRLYKNKTVEKKGKSKKDAHSGDPSTSESESDHPAPRAALSSRAKKASDMPFVESKALSSSVLDANSSEDEDDDDEDDDELIRAKGNRPVLGSSKKRKREEEDDSPLVLHVATSAASTIPPSSPHLASSTHASKNTTRPKSKSGSKRSSSAHAGGGTKGISSGLSTVVRMNGVRKITGKRAPVGQNGRGAHLTGGGSALGSGDWWSKL